MHVHLAAASSVRLKSRGAGSEPAKTGTATEDIPAARAQQVVDDSELLIGVNDCVLAPVEGAASSDSWGLLPTTLKTRGWNFFF